MNMAISQTKTVVTSTSSKCSVRYLILACSLKVMPEHNVAYWKQLNKEITAYENRKQGGVRSKKNILLCTVYFHFRYIFLFIGELFKSTDNNNGLQISLIIQKPTMFSRWIEMKMPQCCVSQATFQIIYFIPYPTRSPRHNWRLGLGIIGPRQSAGWLLLKKEKRSAEGILCVALNSCYTCKS